MSQLLSLLQGTKYIFFAITDVTNIIFLPHIPLQLEVSSALPMSIPLAWPSETTLGHWTETHFLALVLTDLSEQSFSHHLLHFPYLQVRIIRVVLGKMVMSLIFV